jgi:hypothetical protein
VVLKGGNTSSYMKFHVADIEERYAGDYIETEITFDYFYQATNDERFSQEVRSWTAPKFSSAQRFIRWCLDFDNEMVVDCADESWELRFSALNRSGRRRWLLNVNSGAIGPLKYEDMLQRASGL